MTALRFTGMQFALLVVCAVLGAALIYEVFAPLREYRPPSVDNAHAAYTVAMPAMYAPPAFGTYANIDEKSAFNPLRTPIATDTGGTGAAAGDALPSDLALVGIIMDGPTKMALLKSSSAPLAVGVAEGGVFEGWEIASIEPNKVVFAAHGDRQELKLSDNKAVVRGDADNPDNPNTANKPDDTSDDNKPAQASSAQPPPAPTKNDDDSNQ